MTTTVANKSKPEDSNQKKIVYIYDESLSNATNQIPHLWNRANMVHRLIEAYNLTEFMDCIPSKLADVQDLLTFHSNAYIDYLSTETELTEETEEFTSSQRYTDEGKNGSVSDDYGLGYDCPIFKNMKQFACIITGGTVTAVEAVTKGSTIAINWCGGWHHAQRNEASGFCYVNDIVIGIQMLLKHFERVLYIDLDAHHGDGVENAFCYSNKVMTLSVHNYEIGYFPGSGNVDDVGFGRGKYFSVNVPLKAGINDQQFASMFEKVLSLVEEKFKAGVFVVQLGADCLSGDPLGNFNLTENGLGRCVETILKKDVPVIFLGGGGYNLINTAKAWTYVTSIILGKILAFDVPEHEYFTKYGPDFTLQVSPGLIRNENTPASLSAIYESIKANLNHLT